MLIMVESNENTERNKKDNNAREQVGLRRKDASNIRAVKRLQKLFPNLQQAPLACGDINVLLDSGGLLAIERKRAGDFLGSIGNGRIFRQVENMANNSKWHCVIIEGQISFDPNDLAVVPIYDKYDNLSGHETTGWKGASVRGAMYAIQWSGCPILVVEPVKLPYIIADLIQFCSKPAEHSQSLGRKRYVTFPPVSVTEEIVAAFPGVGMKKARSLIEFAQGRNDNGVATLGETLSWGSILPLLDKKVRPEGWTGEKTIENFRTTLGLQTGEFLMIQEDKQQIPKKKGKYNGR